MKGFCLFLMLVMVSPAYTAFFQKGYTNLLDIQPDTPGWEKIVESAPSGSIIYFSPGQYHLESLFFYKRSDISLIGRGQVRFLGYRSDANIITLQYCTNILIHNISLSHDQALGVKSPFCTGDVISTVESADITVSECELNGSGVVGVRTQSVSNIMVVDNIFHQNSVWALDLWDTQELRLVRNIIHDNGGALYLNGTQYSNDLLLQHSSEVYVLSNTYLSNDYHTLTVMDSNRQGLHTLLDSTFINTNITKPGIDINQKIKYIYPHQDWISIVSNLRSGTILEFTSGDYYGNIQLQGLKNIKLLGSVNARIIFTNHMGPALLISHCDSINIEGLEFVSVIKKGGAMVTNDSLAVVYSRNISINESIFKGATGSAITIFQTELIKIETCQVQDSLSWSIDISASEMINVLHNRLIKNRAGIYINGKVFHANSRILEKHDVILRRNVFQKNKVNKLSEAQKKTMETEFYIWKSSL